jgi:uncharacterized protein with HEPN domain
MASTPHPPIRAGSSETICNDDALYLADIIENADAIALRGGRMTTWLEDEVRQSAVMHRLILISGGGALSKSLLRGNRVAWADVVGFRNFAVHEYFAVSWPVVWVTATHDVPALREAVARILAAEFPNL